MSIVYCAKDEINHVDKDIFVIEINYHWRFHVVSLNKETNIMLGIFFYWKISSVNKERGTIQRKERQIILHLNKYMYCHSLITVIIDKVPESEMEAKISLLLHPWQFPNTTLWKQLVCCAIDFLFVNGSWQ